MGVDNISLSPNEKLNLDLIFLQFLVFWSPLFMKNNQIAYDCVKKKSLHLLCIHQHQTLSFPFFEHDDKSSIRSMAL